MFSAASTYAADGVAPFLPSGVDQNRIGDPEEVEGSIPAAAGVVADEGLTGVARGGARRRGSGVTDRRGSGEGVAPRSSTRGLLYPLGRHDGVGGDPRHGAAVDLARAAAAYLDSIAE